MKKFIMAGLASALLLGVGAGVSYAYLTGRDGLVNEFRPTSVDIKIEEEFDPPDKVDPGQVIKKAPRVFSSSDVDCYVRVRVRFSSSEAQDMCEPLVINAGWEEGEDGYYYWLNKLLPGEATGTLFDSLTIRADAGELPDFEILVYAEAVQCKDRERKEAWEDMA